MCDTIHHKSFGLGCVDVNEMCSHIIYMLDGIFVFLYQCLYGILCLILSFCFFAKFSLKEFCFAVFKHDALHGRVWQIKQKLIFYKILDIYRRIKFVNKEGCKWFRKMMKLKELDTPLIIMLNLRF